MIAVTNKDRISGQTYCDGCLLPLIGEWTMRLEAKADEGFTTRTMQLCKECRVKMIHELEKTI